MSQRFIIKGGRFEGGKIAVRGAKNFALKIIAASLLTKEKVIIKNLPQIVDVGVMLDLLKKIGAKVEVYPEKREVEITARDLNIYELDPKEAQKVRASIVFSGPLLARQRELLISHPGGDLIGKRPINFFIDGFVKMGARLKKEDFGYKLEAKDGLKGTDIFFPKISVTGTETLMMAACLAKGRTVLKNCAMEPEVVELGNCLTKMGAKIEGHGTSVIEIEGVEELRGGEFTVIADRIETGTFVMMGIMNGKELLVENCNPGHLEALWDKLKEAGADFEIGPDWVKVPGGQVGKKLNCVSIQTHEYPGFATDLQPIFTLLMTQAKGLSLIHEPIFESRLFFTDMLNRMGANIIMCDPHRVVIKGPSRLIAKNIESPDIRAGIALLLAAIMAKGTSVIENAEIIDRGYEKIEERLRPLGVEIERVR